MVNLAGKESKSVGKRQAATQEKKPVHKPYLSKSTLIGDDDRKKHFVPGTLAHPPKKQAPGQFKYVQDDKKASLSRNPPPSSSSFQP